MNLLYIGLNGINQIASKSIFQIDCTAYNKPYRRFLKKMMGYTGVLDEHHIFPRCLKSHPVLYDIDFNSGKNLKLMPNRSTKKKIYDSNIILKHESHPAYTYYVKTQLDRIDPYSEDREYQIWLLLGHLEQNLNFEGQLPFKNNYLNYDI